MLDFLYKLNDVLPAWPQEEKWTLRQLSQATSTSVPHVLQYLGEGLGKEVEVAALISHKEANDAINLLTTRLRPQIEERERQLAARRAKAVSIVERTREKVHVMQIKKDWHMAFKSLCYVTGQFQEDLPKGEIIALCNEILRVGFKAKTNFQELGRWLEKAVATAMSYQSKAGIEEALDILDAYSEDFLTEDSSKAPLLLGNILAALEEPSARFELWEEYKNLVEQLYPAE